ncbi:MAG: BON domain-containing protein [Bacteriovoracia bacterium]
MKKRVGIGVSLGLGVFCAGALALQGPGPGTTGGGSSIPSAMPTQAPTLAPPVTGAPDITGTARLNTQAPVGTNQRDANVMDLSLTRSIRRDLQREQGLSPLAQGVNIITTQDRITLQGNVRSIRERDRIENLARSRAGTKTVVNEMQIVTE